MDILKGGENLVNRAKIIILEVSFIEHNIGAPTTEETIEYMSSIGFEKKMSIGEHYDGEDLVQQDFVFLNKELVK